MVPNTGNVTCRVQRLASVSTYCVIRRATETAPQALLHEQGVDSTDDLQYRFPITKAMSMLPTGLWNIPLR